MRKLSMVALVAAVIGAVFSTGALASAQCCNQSTQELSPAQADNHHQDHDTHGQHAEMANDHHMLMKTVYSDYFTMGSALAHDSMENVTKSSADIANKIDSFLKTDSGSEQPNPLLRDIQVSAGNLAEKKDIAAARAEFGNLSERLVDYQSKFVTDKSEKAHVFFCDMIKEPWLQQESEIANPYYGASMLKCGREIK